MTKAQRHKADLYAIRYTLYAVLVSLLVRSAFASADPKKQYQEGFNGRTTALHNNIILLDENGQKVVPDSNKPLPFSTRTTCTTRCHSYEQISKGWHVNAVDPNIPPGRAGQPWFFTDSATATQIPLSYRQWPGTFTPQQIGLTNRQFVKMFGRQTPGGGAGELIDRSGDPEEVIRGMVSGNLEINCMACHDGSAAPKQVEYPAQIAKENFRWAAAATCDFVTVNGSAKDMPDTYDPFFEEPVSDSAAPLAVYDKSVSEKSSTVFLNIPKKPLKQRCYFCHSTRLNKSENSPVWISDEDVHLAAGMVCSDCHRSTPEHRVVRGYEGEENDSPNRMAAYSSCRGCHMGTGGDIPAAGRLGAPVAKHAGLPAVHLEKLSCTACHSGIWPQSEPLAVKTSMAHGLGTYNPDKSTRGLPHIVSPVFAKSQDGKIAPHNMVWPAFWAAVKDGEVKPLAIDLVKSVVAGMIPAGSSVGWPQLTEEQIAAILASAASQGSIDGKPAYVAGGKLYSLDGSGRLSVADDDAARPYLWPIAHDIRPAGQSLGVRGCDDCHSSKSPLFFGKVPVDSPVASAEGLFKSMFEFEQVPACYTKFFSMFFWMRNWSIAVILLCCCGVAAVLVLYVFKVLHFILRAFGDR